VENLCKQGRYEEACDVCDYGVWAKSGDAFLRQSLKRRWGKIYMENLHKYEEAAAIFSNYLTNEVTQDRQVMAQVTESYGDALAAQEVPHWMALKQYERALPHIPDRAHLYLKMADVHRRHRNYPKALWTLERLLTGNRNHWQALQKKAEIYLEQGDAYSAHNHAAQALTVVKDLHARHVLRVRDPLRVFAGIHGLLGMCFLLEGNHDEAQVFANLALSEDSRCYQAYNVFGRMHLRQGDIVRAMRSFSVSLRLKPDQPEIQRWLEEASGRGGG
jgi:tetratricopeptide (TPR) repeat protein